MSEGGNDFFLLKSAKTQKMHYFPQKNLSHKNEKKANQIDDDENINLTILIIVLVNFESRLDYFITKRVYYVSK